MLPLKRLDKKGVPASDCWDQVPKIPRPTQFFTILSAALFREFYADQKWISPGFLCSKINFEKFCRAAVDPKPPRTSKVMFCVAEVDGDNNGNHEAETQPTTRIDLEGDLFSRSIFATCLTWELSDTLYSW